MKEIQQYKNEYMAKKLDLSDDQKVRFAPVLDRMDAELRKVQSQARKLCRDVTKKVTRQRNSRPRRPPRHSLRSRPRRLRSR